ncbi:MAG: ComEC/Rec2 family competence protein [Candidatus Pacebacteria bacterium]|nr:ComEC/Rec2 family competence protein [Candidatus Paceibacterota bacterium]
MLSHSQIFLYLCIGFISGIFLGSFFHSYYLIYFLIIISFSLISILWKRKHVLAGVFLILTFCLGYFCVNNRLDNVLNNEITEYFNSEVEIVGKVSRNPKDDLETKKAILKVEKVNDKELNSNILIFTNKDLNYGDKVSIKGKLEKPENYADFDYIMYLANQEITGIIKYPEIEVLSKNNFFIYDFKNKAEKLVLEKLSISKASILNATILGETDTMSSDLKQNLGFSGISHVVAISGQHIILLCAIMLSFLNYLKVGRKKAIVITFLFILFYIVLIDFPASALRAFIMMSFIMLAELLGRETDSIRSLIMAAVLILIFNPLALVYDLGFELSFLAVLGIIFFNNYFKEKLKFIKNQFLNDLIAVNFSAQVFVLPLLAYTFGFVSLSSFITNILVVPISTIMLIFGFLCVVIALILPSLSFFIFLPISLILGYILIITNTFSFMIIEINDFPLILLLIIYIALGFVAFKLRRNKFDFYF